MNLAILWIVLQIYFTGWRSFADLWRKSAAFIIILCFFRFLPCVQSLSNNQMIWIYLQRQHRFEGQKEKVIGKAEQRSWSVKSEKNHLTISSLTLYKRCAALGQLSFHEISVLVVFCLLVLLWFFRYIIVCFLFLKVSFNNHVRICSQFDQPSEMSSFLINQRKPGFIPGWASALQWVGWE